MWQTASRKVSREGREATFSRECIPGPDGAGEEREFVRVCRGVGDMK